MLPALIEMILLFDLKGPRELVTAASAVAKLAASDDVFVALGGATECLFPCSTVPRAITVKDECQLAIVALTVARSSGTACLTTSPRAVPGRPIPRAAKVSVALATI